VLPVIIRTTEESLKAVDDTFRQASFGLGPVSGKRRVKLYFQSHFKYHYRIIDRKSFWRRLLFYLPLLLIFYLNCLLLFSIRRWHCLIIYMWFRPAVLILKIKSDGLSTLVLIIIVLISNLLANALRKYYGKKVKWINAINY
jgi:phosphate transport system permease protein